MTAVVGILNKQGVAIAADSAVTVNGKVYTRAMKVFSLSKYKPIGIMIYSAAYFMEVPWEIIIKLYRKKLGTNSFNLVNDYKDDFIKFLRDNKFFSNTDQQKKHIGQEVYNVFYRLRDECQLKHIEDPSKPIIDHIDEHCDLYLNYINISYTEPSSDFIDFTQDIFNASLKDIFDGVIDQAFTQLKIDVTKVYDKLLEIAFKLIKYNNEYLSYTGLVFTGFGEEEIFPSLVAIDVFFPVENRLKFFEHSNVSITHEMAGSIKPFAQTEVMTTFLSGIAGKLEDTYSSSFVALLKKYNSELVSQLKPSIPDIDTIINAINIGDFKKEFDEKIIEAKNTTYIYPLMQAVCSLSKDDLAEMAESLVYLTYLQKRINFAEENVSGPIDVAVISKGDGFIWIKRKHYFKPELNQHFFDNYFKE